MQPMILRDGVVLLSAPTEADVDDLTAACQDGAIAAWTTVPSPYSRSDAEGFLHDVVGPGWASGRECVWAVRDATDGRLLGMCGLHGVANGSAAIGYWVAPWARGRGVVGRAVALVLDAAFDPAGLALQRVSWSAFVGNWPSRRVAWRAGFLVEGTVRQHCVQRGVRRDAWVGTLLRDDARRPAEPWPEEASDGGSARPR